MINQLLVQTYSAPVCCTREKLPDFLGGIPCGEKVDERLAAIVNLLGFHLLAVYG